LHNLQWRNIFVFFLAWCDHWNKNKNKMPDQLNTAKKGQFE
jgi:hypothetical protein